MNIVVNKRSGKRYTPEEVQFLIERLGRDPFAPTQIDEDRRVYPLKQELADFLEAVKTILIAQPNIDMIVDGNTIKTAYVKPVVWPAGLLSNMEA